MIRHFHTLLIGFFVFFLNLTVIANYPPVPTPFRYVSDYTNTLSTQELQTLENALTNYSQKTSSQIAVAIVPNTNGEEISSYTHTLFNRWSIGQKGLNNGVLLLIAKNDRKLFIATGRGLEGALPDAVASSIIRNDITPYFKQNLYAQGIAKGLSSIIAATQGEYAPLTAEKEDSFSETEIFIIIAVIIFFLFNVLARKRSGVYISPSQVDRFIRTTDSIRRNSGFDQGFGRGGSGSYGGGRSNGGFGGGNTGGGGAGGSW